VTFWELFFILLIFIPLLMLWVFALVDLFGNDDLSGAAKALWAIAIVLLPLVGMLVYFIVRGSGDANAAAPTPPPPARRRRPVTPTPAPAAMQTTAIDAVDQLERLADLRDRGILTDEEFQREKDKLLGESPG
jgi:heme/copper-type cytochrome/quinol oxidase subunit 2